MKYFKPCSLPFITEATCQVLMEICKQLLNGLLYCAMECTAYCSYVSYRFQSHDVVVPPMQVVGRNKFARSPRKIPMHPKSKPICIRSASTVIEHLVKLMQVFVVCLFLLGWCCLIDTSEYYPFLKIRPYNKLEQHQQITLVIIIFGR